MILYTWVGSKYEPIRNLHSASGEHFIKLSTNESGSRKPALSAQLGSRLWTGWTCALSFYNTLTFKISLFKNFKKNHFLEGEKLALRYMQVVQGC